LRTWPDLTTAPGNETVRVISAKVEAEAGHDPEYWSVDTPLVLTFRIFNCRPDLPLYFNFHLYNQEGTCVFNTASPRAEHPYGEVEATCRIPANLLNDAKYTVRFMTHYRGTFGVIVDDAVVFEIHDAGRQGNDYYDYDKWTGVIRPRLEWTVREVGQSVVQGGQ
jgi:lipopolysaccharide transport system ATP-binding protein